MQVSQARTAALLRTHDLGIFREAVSSSLVPLSVRGRPDAPFSGVIGSVAVEGVSFTDISASPLRVERTLENMQLGGGSRYKLSVMVEGSGLLVQDGRSSLMRPGDLHLYDTSRPYSLQFDRSFRNLVIAAPVEYLSVASARLTSLTATSLSGEHPLADVIASLITRSSPLLAGMDPRSRMRLARSALDLTEVLVRGVLDDAAATAESAAALLEGARRYIRRNLASPSLTPGTIAAAQHVSLRRLHSLFRESGTTVGAFVRRLRLERCREELLDPSLQNLGVAEIGARWGFADAAHFSRVFRAAYGVPPGRSRAGRGFSTRERFEGESR